MQRRVSLTVHLALSHSLPVFVVVRVVSLNSGVTWFLVAKPPRPMSDPLPCFFFYVFLYFLYIHVSVGVLCLVPGCVQKGPLTLSLSLARARISLIHKICLMVASQLICQRLTHVPMDSVSDLGSSWARIRIRSWSRSQSSVRPNRNLIYLCSEAQLCEL